MKNKNIEGLLVIVKNLPQEPGVYQYFDAFGTIIYVGKAKNIKKRVNSYFTASAQHTKKVRALVAKIADIKVNDTNMTKSKKKIQSEQQVYPVGHPLYSKTKNHGKFKRNLFRLIKLLRSTMPTLS